MWLVEPIRAAMEHVSPSQVVSLGTIGTVLTYAFKPENLAVVSGVLTVIFLALKIIETIWSWVHHWKQESKKNE